MQFDNFQQILWCLLLCMTTTKAGRGSGKAEILLKFPKYPNIAYKSYPLQGICYGIPGTGGEVYFRLTGKNVFDSVLGTYNLRRNKIEEWRPMKSMSVKQVPAEYFRKNNLPGRKGLAFAFCVPRDMEDPLHIVCQTRNSSRLQTSILVKQIFTESLPDSQRPPLIIAHYHLPPRQLIKGEILKLYCAGHVGTNGRMIFDIPERGQKKKMMWTINYDTSRSPAIQACRGCPKATITVNRRETSIGPRIDATLLLRVDDTLDQRVYYCFTANGPGYKQKKSSARESTVVEIPSKPVLRVKRFEFYGAPDPREFWGIEGFCNTSLEHSRKLSIILKTSKRTVTYNSATMVYRRFKTQHFVTNRSAVDDLSYLKLHRVTNSTMLSIKIFVILRINSRLVTLSCKVKDLMVCQTFKAPVYKYSNGFEDVSNTVFIRLVPTTVAIVLLLVLIVIVTYKTLSRKQIMDRWRTEMKKQRKHNYVY